MCCLIPLEEHKASNDLFVHAIIDLVELVLGHGLKGDEVTLKLLEGALLSRGEVWDFEDIIDGLVGTVGDDETGKARIEARKLLVGADVGVVDVNDVTAA